MSMRKINLVSALLLLAFYVCAGVNLKAQDAVASPTATPSDEAKSALEKQAYALLEDVVTDAQALKLPENRVRMQVAAADLLWKRDEGRARTLFTNAAAALTELLQQANGNNDRQAFNQARTGVQLRQELVLAVARHDAPLAYQIFQTTRPQQQTATDVRGGRQFMNDDSFLEQRLLALVAATDPALALRKAEEMLDKGDYSATLASVLTQLQQKDKTAAARLSDKILARLQPDNLLASREADNLAFTLLQPGPRPGDTPQPASAQTTTGNTMQVLNDAAYRSLMENLIAAALKATPNQIGTTNGFGGPRGGGLAINGQITGGGRGTRTTVTTSSSSPSQPTDAQVEQSNARMMLMTLQMLLPQIDQYASSRAPAVRQKLTELGTGNNNNPRAAMVQLASAMQQGTSDSLLAAAATAPPQLQSRIYQQAAFKALDEGNVDRARQIASDHLDADTRGTVTQAIETKQTITKAKANQLEDVRQTLARLSSDEERVELLLQLADAAQADNQKLALQFLEEARTLVMRRATSYPELDRQVQVAHAYVALDPARGFEVLEPGINQLNELLPAAAALSGFELNVFKDGEMALSGNNMLGSMVSRYGQELAVLAKSDFERAKTTADRFQYPEARLLVRLAIVQGVLGTRSVPINNRFNNRRGFAQNAPVIVRQ
jgi:hypothetical protein